MDLEQKIVGHGKPILASKLNQILQKGENATCKIRNLNKVGSGFICKLNLINEEPKKFLFTNNHILDENFFNNNNNLVIIYKDKEKEIKLNNKIKYTNKNLDFTIIEIQDEDNISDYFEIDLYINSEENQYLKRDIGILQYPNGNELSFDKGEVKSITNYRLIHTVSTDYGSSGSPIFLIENLKIIGVHNSRWKKLNAGIFMKNILDDLNFKSQAIIYKKIIISSPIILSSYTGNNNNNNSNIIDKFQNEEVFQFCIKCPIDGCCDDKDKVYMHKECGEITYINKKGEIICPKCKNKENFHSCQFECSYFNRILFPSKDPQRIIAAFALFGRLKSGGGKKLFKSLLDNLIDECDSDSD